MAADYKKKVGFKGTLLLEPKPQVRMGAGRLQCMRARCYSR